MHSKQVDTHVKKKHGKKQRDNKNYSTEKLVGI